MNGKVIMGAGITGAVLVVAVGALLIRPWQRPPKPPNVLTDNAAEQATHILAQPTFAGALAYARPAVVDGGPGFGQVLLAVWAVDRLRWADIEVDVPETSLPLFKKDPDAERGKRLCADVGATHRCGILRGTKRSAV